MYFLFFSLLDYLPSLFSIPSRITKRMGGTYVFIKTRERNGAYVATLNQAQPFFIFNRNCIRKKNKSLSLVDADIHATVCSKVIKLKTYKNPNIIFIS